MERSSCNQREAADLGEKDGRLHYILTDGTENMGVEFKTQKTPASEASVPHLSRNMQRKKVGQILWIYMKYGFELKSKKKNPKSLNI